MNRSHLVVAHPGHELLLHGWICRTAPVVHVLTDGSSAPRLAAAAELLRDAGARPGAIFGRLSDREVYAMILERNAALVVSIAGELAEEIAAQRPEMIVCDAAEGYNPAHDLCRLIAGAAIAIAGSNAALYEYAVVDDPDPSSLWSAAAMPPLGHATTAVAWPPHSTFVFELDDVAYAAKMERARRCAAFLPDVGEMLSRHGAEAYRREVFRRVADWTDLGSGAPPRYESFGEERVAAQRYARVIRRDEHMAPLRDALRAEVEKRSCAF